MPDLSPPPSWETARGTLAAIPRTPPESTKGRLQTHSLILNSKTEKCNIVLILSRSEAAQRTRLYLFTKKALARVFRQLLETRAIDR